MIVSTPAASGSPSEPSIRRVGADGRISTVADGLGSGHPSDPWGLARDGSGRLYLADYWLGVRRIGADGAITTVAGNGQQGSSGDGGPATEASASPYNLVIDGQGNILFTEPTFHRVRRVTGPIP